MPTDKTPSRVYRADARRASRPAYIDANQLYSVEESAAALDMGRCSVYVLIKNGTLQPVKLGARTRISGAEIIRIATGPASQSAV